MNQEYFSHHSFFSNLERITSQEYVPSDEDIIMCRVRTTGVSEMPFQIQGVKFRFAHAQATGFAAHKNIVTVWRFVFFLLIAKKKSKFKRMVDVGGQRNERRKWIHFFDDVEAVNAPPLHPLTHCLSSCLYRRFLGPKFCFAITNNNNKINK